MSTSMRLVSTRSPPARTAAATRPPAACLASMHSAVSPTLSSQTPNEKNTARISHCADGEFFRKFPDLLGMQTDQFSSFNTKRHHSNVLRKFHRFGVHHFQVSGLMNSTRSWFSYTKAIEIPWGKGHAEQIEHFDRDFQMCKKEKNVPHLWLVMRSRALS
jgi:hypothetical protein